MFPALFLFTDKGGNEFLTFLNMNNQLLFYDLKSGDFLFKIQLENEGANGIPQVTGYHIEDFNNIYITSYGKHGLAKIDTSGTLRQTIVYKKTEEGYDLSLTFKSQSFYYTPLFIIDGKFFITQHPFWYSPISKTPVSAVIDTVTGISHSLPFKYPSLFKDDELMTHFTGFGVDFSRDFDGNRFIYSFFFDENIYVTSIDHKNQECIPVKSRYIPKIRNEKKPSDIKLFAKKINELPYYGNLVYDKYRQVYYRFAYPEVSLDDNIDHMQMTAHGRSIFSIIILDKNFHIVGETIFPEFAYTPTVFFVHKNGLFIKNNHMMRSDFDENILSFECLELKKTN